MNSLELFSTANVYKSNEDYAEAVKYYTLYTESKPDEINNFINIAKCLKKLGFDNSYIESYLMNIINNQEKFNKIMMAVYFELHEYGAALTLPDTDLDNECIKTKIMCLYKIEKYLLCFNTIMSNYEMLNDDYYKIMALCCILLNDTSLEPYCSELFIKLKNDKLFGLLDAYNLFFFESKYYGESSTVEGFCSILIYSSNKKCIKYVRNTLDKVISINYADLALKAYDNNLFYLCDEILNLYCSEIKNDYNILLLKAKVLYKLNNLSECQKYISCTRTLKDSKELYKLLCLCKVKECINTINSNPEASKLKSIENVLIYLKKAQDILL